MVEILDPDPDEMIIDRACGSGGFLIVALDHVWRKVEAMGRKKKWSQQRIREEQGKLAPQATPDHDDGDDELKSVGCDPQVVPQE